MHFVPSYFYLHTLDKILLLHTFRYLANAHGLGGRNALESGLMDEIVDALSDATEKQYNAYLFEKVLLIDI